jgi:hypothetical protein
VSDDIRIIAEGMHNYMGLCPDGLNGPNSRDPDCPVCQALNRVEKRIRTLEAELNRLLSKVHPDSKLSPEVSIQDTVTMACAMIDALKEGLQRRKSRLARMRRDVVGVMSFIDNRRKFILVGPKALIGSIYNELRAIVREEGEGR